MTDIRNIGEHECEEYLSVLCESFGLDLARARTAFFGEPYFSLDRKWALFNKRRIVSILTVVPIEFGDGHGIGIAGVATLEDERGEGLATALLNHVVGHYETAGAKKALLFARADSLYRRSGFDVLDRVYSQPLPPGRVARPNQLLYDDVRAAYDRWAAEDHRRLRRDDERWKYWAWTFKTALAIDGGYFCYESNRVREILPRFTRLPIAEHVDFYGTGELAQDLGIEITDTGSDLLLMGRGFDYVPRMFMTDQF